MSWRPWTRAEDYPSEPQPVPTIGDQEWRDLQDRAMRASPELADSFSDASIEGTRRGAENYRHRRMN